jgi:hypothetical protein
MSDPTMYGPTFLLERIREMSDSDVKAAILDARSIGDITSEQAEILIRLLGLAAA